MERIARTETTQIVTSTNEQPQSAKKYEQRYLSLCNRGSRNTTARGPFSEIATTEFLPQRVHGTAFPVESINKNVFIFDYLPTARKILVHSSLG